MSEDFPEVVGPTEIAAHFNVRRNSAWRWTRRGDFPEPVARLKSGPIWRLADVEKWAAERPRRRVSATD